MSITVMNYNNIVPIEIFKDELDCEPIKRNTFTKIPNKLINSNLKSQYGINSILPYVYYLIDRHCDVTGHSYVIPSQILNTLGYSMRRNKPNVFYSILNSLMCLQKSNYIKMDMNLDDFCKAGYDTFIPINIISSHFYKDSNFTKIYHSDIDKIINIKSTNKMETLIYVYMCICSYITIRPRDENGKEVMYNPETKPEFFNRNIRSVSNETGVSKKSLFECLNSLTENKLLVKRIISVKQPAIYVLNTPGWEQELNWAMQKISKFGYEETEK